MSFSYYDPATDQMVSFTLGNGNGNVVFTNGNVIISNGNGMNPNGNGMNANGNRVNSNGNGVNLIGNGNNPDGNTSNANIPTANPNGNNYHSNTFTTFNTFNNLNDFLNAVNRSNPIGNGHHPNPAGNNPHGNNLFANILNSINPNGNNPTGNVPTGNSSNGFNFNGVNFQHPPPGDYGYSGNYHGTNINVNLGDRTTFKETYVNGVRTSSETWVNGVRVDNTHDRRSVPDDQPPQKKSKTGGKDVEVVEKLKTSEQLNEYGRELVTVFIGPEYEHLTLPVGLLCALSPYFHDLLQKERKEIKGNCDFCKKDLKSGTAEAPKQITFCRGCGVNFHYDCIKQRKEHLRIEGSATEPTPACPMCSTQWNEYPVAQKITCPEQHVYGMKIFVKYLKATRLSSKLFYESAESTGLSHDRAINAYIFGGEIKDTAFQLAVLHNWIDAMASSKNYPGVHTVVKAYNLSNDDDIIKQLLVAIYAIKQQPHWWFDPKHSSNLPKTFRSDLSAKMVELKGKVPDFKEHMKGICKGLDKVHVEEEAGEKLRLEWKVENDERVQWVEDGDDDKATAEDESETKAEETAADDKPEADVKFAGSETATLAADESEAEETGE
jgi:hypothetical protein